MLDWIQSIRNICTPNKVHYCTGTETPELIDDMVMDGMLIKLNEKLRPNSYLARSDPSDVARLESCTYICTNNKEDAGPNNNWEDPITMKQKLSTLIQGCMTNKTMYIVPFVMGALGDEHSIYGIQITDSPYNVVNMNIMTKMGSDVWDYINNNEVTLIKCFHSVLCADGTISTEGNPLSLKWYSNKTKYISHFPETLEIISVGSGYGGNAILAKKCVALRIASYLGQKNGWLAEHMLLIGLTPPNDCKTIYITGSFPSACGKTNLGLLKPALPGWKVTVYGDDITWLRLKDDKLYGMNPETGFFGVAPNTSWNTNPNCMETIKDNTIFTNVALTKEGDIWWEGLTKEIPEGLIDWCGKEYTMGYPAAHPNARFTVSITNCPIAASNHKEWVPISAILLGGKRKDVVPLVREALSWNHGIYMGSTISSEITAASELKVGDLRYDPFAMLPFCGYHMGQYFQHWLSMNSNVKFFYVNWFRRDKEGKFLWPGFSQNIRVLEWIYNRVTNNISAIYTPIGYIPNNLNMTGLDNVNIECTINNDEWIKQLTSDRTYLESLDAPQKIIDENSRMLNELNKW